MSRTRLLLAHVSAMSLAADERGADPGDVTDEQALAEHFGVNVVWVNVDRPDWPFTEPRPALPWVGLVPVGQA